MLNLQDDDNNQVVDSSPSDENIEDVSSEQPTEESEETSVPGKKSAEARINELVGEVKTLKEKLEERVIAPAPQTQVPTPPIVTPEMKKAVDALRNLEFVQKNDLEERFRAMEDRMLLNSEHLRLEGSYTGSDGRPKYNRSKVEDFMRERGIGDPDIAYNALHRTELDDWMLKKAEQGTKKKPFVEKPGGSGIREDNIITREKIKERVDAGDREWYEANRAKILEVMSKGGI